MRVLKNIDYYQLVALIYRYANYSKCKSILLYNYAAYHLLNGGFNELYVDKLSLDLNLLDVENDDKSYALLKSSYKKNLAAIDEHFTRYEIINIKATIWDIMHKGYYE